MKHASRKKIILKWQLELNRETIEFKTTSAYRFLLCKYNPFLKVNFNLKFIFVIKLNFDPIFLVFFFLDNCSFRSLEWLDGLDLLQGLILERVTVPEGTELGNTLLKPNLESLTLDSSPVIANIVLNAKHFFLPKLKNLRYNYYLY